MKPLGIITKDEAQIEVEQLRQLAVSLARSDRLTVVLNSKSTNSFCMPEKGYIVISDQSIPENLREVPRFVRRARDALVAHEVGHIVITGPMEKHYEDWVRFKVEALAKRVINIVDDKRINHFMRARYRWDVGKRLEELDALTGVSWKNTFLKKMASGEKAWTLQESFPQLLCMAGIYDTDVDDAWEKLFTRWGTSPQARETVLADFSYATNLVHRAPFVHMVPKLLGIMEEVYTTLLKYTTVIPAEIIAKTLEGGTLEIFAPSEVVEALEQAEIEAELLAQEGQGEGGTDKPIPPGKGTDEVAISIGGGLGVEIPSPEPNPSAYEKLVLKNASRIDELLRLLKTLTKPEVHRAKWRPRGRFMSEIVGKAYASSLRRPVTNVYDSQDLRVTPHEVLMGLLVDLSGSMSISQARDVLTVIAETGGRWLRDDALSVLVFGSDYQKVKTFVESYHNTRYRIGGTQNLGGTVMNPPLEELGKLFSGTHSDDPKVLVIVSDFWVSDKEGVKTTIGLLRRLGVVVIGVGLCSGDLENVRRYTGDQSTYVDNVDELPDLFFRVYRKALEGKL